MAQSLTFRVPSQHMANALDTTSDLIQLKKRGSLPSPMKYYRSTVHFRHDHSPRYRLPKHYPSFTRAPDSERQ